MEKFNLEKELESLGFVTIDKQRECLSIKGNIAIYYYVSTELDESQCPIGMIIENANVRIYEGIVPTSTSQLSEILKSANII